MRHLLPLLLVFLTGEVLRAADPPRKPNIVLIMADDLGYADVGCYGSNDIRTPHIDRLAKEGVRLTDCYAAACVCSPTRAALLTGRYPQRAGFDWVIDYGEKGPGLPVTDTSLAKVLKKEGYATGLFGKWHLGYPAKFGPNAHGFDEFFGLLAADLDYYGHQEATGEHGLYENTAKVKRKGYLTDLITDRCVAFVRQHAKQPFFLFASYNAPHYPFQVPGKPNDIRTRETYGRAIGTRADYVQMVERLDWGIGEILKALDEAGLTANSLVIFTSDNGGERLSDNGPFFHGKRTLWEGGLRVPGIFRWPGKLPADTVCRQPVITMDLTASILAAAGAKLPEGERRDGEDVLPILAGKQPVKERTFFWRLAVPTPQFGQWAARSGKWKLMFDRQVFLLFDLERDPGERRNVAAQNPEVFERLRRELIAWNNEMGPPRPLTPPGER